MLNRNLLKSTWVKEGLKQKDVANILGISPESLTRKLRSGIFKTDEAAVLIKALKIENPVEIFFG